MLSFFSNINIPAFAALIIYPLFLIFLLCKYLITQDFTSSEFLLIVIGYYVSNISVGVGLHRLWSHNAFKANKIVEFILMLFTAGTLQGPVLSWASNHYKHHSFTDQEEDPHSPLKFKNPVLGFLWSHIGWMLVGEGSYKMIDRITMAKLGKNKLLRWQLKYYWQLAVFMNLVLPMSLGYVFGGDFASAYKWFLFIGIGRAVQQQATFCVNSLCHFLGTHDYCKGTAGDIWWFALFLLGENWHNFHHAFPSDYRNGVKWYHFDVHKWIIYLMSVVGLAWDLNRTPDERIEAKSLEARRLYLNNYKDKFLEARQKSAQLVSSLNNVLAELDSSSSSLKLQLKNALSDFQSGFNKVTEQVGSLVDQINVNNIDFNFLSNSKVKDTLESNVEKAEYLVYKFSKRLENLLGKI